MSVISADPDKPYEAASEGVGIRPNKAVSAGSGQAFAVKRYAKTAAADMYGGLGQPLGVQKVVKLKRVKAQSA